MFARGRLHTAKPPLCKGRWAAEWRLGGVVVSFPSIPPKMFLSSHFCPPDRCVKGSDQCTKGGIRGFCRRSTCFSPQGLDGQWPPLLDRSANADRSHMRAVEGAGPYDSGPTGPKISLSGNQVIMPYPVGLRTVGATCGRPPSPARKSRPIRAAFLIS